MITSATELRKVLRQTAKSYQFVSLITGSLVTITTKTHDFDRAWLVIKHDDYTTEEVIVQVYGLPVERLISRLEVAKVACIRK